MSIDLDSLTDEELAGLIEDAKTLLAKRQSRAAVDRQVADVLRTARDEGVTEAPVAGAAWVQPTSAVDAYLKGDVVEHDGKTWVALIDYAVHEPGVAGWREQAADGTPPEWTQPSGSTDVYNTGDRVTFRGDVYVSLIDANSWSPEAHPAGWERVE